MSNMYRLVTCQAHRLAGVLIALSVYVSPALTIAGVYFYVKYQIREYKQIKDTCYQDIREAMVPFFITCAVMLVIKLVSL